MIKYSLMAFALFLAGPNFIQAGPVVRSASGASPASIQATVDQFRTDVSLGGALNAPNTGPFVIGRREINWDGVPDAVADPNALPGTFFNDVSKRGALLTTPGTALAVSANAVNPTGTPVRFGSINPGYPANFQTFSPQRLFAALGSTIVDVTFFVPTSPSTPATVNGFGSVFTDVEIAGSTTIEYFDANGDSLGTFAAPVGPNAGLSFLGVSFDAGERVARVRITSGNAPLGPVDSPTVDVVVMDDFIYSEPLADSDNDGVPDAFDNCPDTGAGEVVDASGCSIAQLVPCDGPLTGGKWKNHGEYVSATAHVATDFLEQGLITHAERAAIVAEAAQSNCGKKANKPR